MRFQPVFPDPHFHEDRHFQTGYGIFHLFFDKGFEYVDLVFMGSSNDMHLNAFKESPEWMSFKARMELVGVPYLLDYSQPAPFSRAFKAYFGVAPDQSRNRP